PMVAGSTLGGQSVHEPECSGRRIRFRPTAQRGSRSYRRVRPRSVAVCSELAKRAVANTGVIRGIWNQELPEYEDIQRRYIRTSGLRHYPSVAAVARYPVQLRRQIGQFPQRNLRWVTNRRPRLAGIEKYRLFGSGF